MDKEQTEKVYKEIQKRINEKKLVIMDFGITDEGFHRYHVIIFCED